MASSATVGSAVIKLSFDGKNVKAELDGVSKQLESSGKKSGSKWGSAWAVAAGSLISKGFSKVASMVSSSMDGAINRLDTLNNFPKVMESLGYASEDASKSVNAMSDALDGMPTTLDNMAGDVQKLAATMGNLADGEVNATSVGIGLNNMFLAGGKGTEAASRAMEQYNQMLSAGKADMQSWRSILDAAPGQLKQLAETLLGAGASQEDLRQALNDGTVSFDQMNEAIVRLNSEGGEGFSSFSEQAKAATGGIATQIENVSATINKIVAAALDGNLDDMSKYIDQLTSRVSALVPTLVQGFTGAFTTLMKALPGMIKELLPVIMQGLKDLLVEITNMLPDFVNMITDAIPMFIDGLTQLLNALVNAIPMIMPQLVQAITSLITNLALQLTRPDFLSAILRAGITLLLELVKALPQVLTALVEALPQIIENIVSFLLDPANLAMIIDGAVQLFLGLVMAVPQILGALIGAFGKLVGDLWNGITSMFGEFAANFGNFIGNIFKGAINGILTFIENFINAPIDLLNGFIGIINDAFGWVGVNLGYINRISLPRLAQGGFVTGATTALIGEDGAEAVLPLENNTDNWAGLLASTLVAEMEIESVGRGGVTIEKQEFIINNQMDAEEIGRVMMQSIRRSA